MFKSKLLSTILITGLLAAGLIGCQDDSTGPEGEETTFTVQVQNVNMPKPVLKSGAVASPGGPDEGPAIFPGETAAFSFTAPASTLAPLGGSGMHLNLATMFVQSNDLFYAFPPEGLDLYDAEGNPTTGDVTDQIFLYDAGTEVNEEPGVGATQKPRQSGPDTGTDENGNVVVIQDGQEGPGGFTYPDKSEVIQVTIEHDGGSEFTVNVTNVSQNTTLQTSEGGKPVPLSPFAWAVHENATGFTLYRTGEAASRGIEWIAEDGFPADMLGETDLPPTAEDGLADVVATQTGLIIPLSPPVLAVHDNGFQVFTVGQPAGEGIETVAEDGFPADMLGGNDLPPTPDRALVDILSAEEQVRSVTAMPNTGGNVPALEPAAGGQGKSVEFTVTASPGQRLALATMYVQSNDYFFGFGGDGLNLFDASGNPISGDITDRIVLYDAGTEVDEEPGVGPTQKPRQGATAEDVGEEEGGTVTAVVAAGAEGGTDDGFSYLSADQVIRVTITPTSTGTGN